ncbi:MAG TPA: adenylate/guanylate cyclase domain-containing protein [Gaiellaceae bacterium]|nr:adenylate/guanylate cyclase domain-containing protein [Gaiellaceae bacterium]
MNVPAARFCAGCGRPLDAGTRPLETAERRQLTVLMCDLVGSTELSQSLDPEDLRELLADYQRVCAEAVEHHDGHIAQYLGDGVLVYFGFPYAHEDDARRAIRCGLDILGRMRELDSAATRRCGVRLSVRAGAHTGRVVVGTVGTGARQEMLAQGDTPNIAARVQAHADPDSLAVTDATWRMVRGYFHAEPLGARELKGLAEQMRLWRITGASGAKSRLEADRFLTRYVGRELELRALERQWGAVAAGAARFVTVRGEPGIGKSRLVQEFTQGVGADVERLELRFTSYTQNSAFQPVIELIERRLGLERSLSPDLRLERIEERLRELGITASEAAPLWAELLSIPAAERYRPLVMSPARRRARTVETLVAAFQSLASRGPTIVVAEDLHWGDASTLELLQLLVSSTSQPPLLGLFTARPEFQPPWAAQDAAAFIEMSRLADTEVATVARAVAHDKTLPAEVLRLILERCDGVPLFVEEVVQTVIDSGVLEEREGSWELTGPVPAGLIPASIDALLTARIDQLGESRATAQLAATIGREFSWALLHAVSDLHENALGEDVRRIVAAGIVREAPSGNAGTYVFKHALVQEAAYESLLRSERRRLHERIARVLAADFVEEVDLHPEILARHLEYGGRVADAVVQWMRAGQREVQRSANAEAILHLEHALELLLQLSDDDERARLELPLRVLAAVPLTLTRGWTAREVEAHYRRARELCQRVGETPELFPTLVGLVTYLIVSGQLEEARAMGEADLLLARDQGNPEHELEAEVDLGNTLFYLGRPREALVHLERVDELYHPERDRVHAFSYGKEPAAVARLHRALALWCLGRPDSALRCTSSAEALAREWPHPFTNAWIQTGAAVLRILRGEVEAAQAHAETAIAISVVEGFPNWLAQANVYRGWALVAEGDEGGLAQIEEGLGLWSATGAQLMLGFLRCVMADAQGRCGRYAEALQALDAAIAHARRTGDCWYEPEMMRLSAELALKADRQRPEEAAARVRDAVRLAAGRSQLLLELRSATSLARISGDPEDTARLRDCYESFDEGHETADLAAARSVIEGLPSAAPVT